MKLKSFEQFIHENIEILKNKNVVPLSKMNKNVAKAAIDSGKTDGELSDDSVSGKKVNISVNKLTAAQTEIIPEKAIGMAIGMMLNTDPVKIGGDLGSIISKDNFIMDGHHRWAAVVAHNAANPKNQIPMNVRVIDEPIEPLVKRSNAFAEKMGIRAKKADTGAAGGPSPITK
jgi:hypothetical protein